MSNESGELAERLQELHGVPVEVTVELGRKQATFREALALRPGSTLSLARSVSGPVDVVVAGKRLAFGELVLIGDDVGVRIAGFVSAEADAE